MNKLGFSGMKSFDHFKSLSGSVLGSSKTYSIASRPASETLSVGSFANLKLTAEKLVKEQASVKSDLEMANLKLKKSNDHVRALEEKLQNAFNENAKLKVKQKEDEKLWKGLESKFSSTKTLCDQLTETLQLLAGQVNDAEHDKKIFEDKLSASSKAIDGLQQLMNELSLKLESSEETVRECTKELKERRIVNEETDKLYRNEQCITAKLKEEKDAMNKQFEATVAANSSAVEHLNSKMEELHLETRLKEDQIRHLKIAQENLAKQNYDLQSSNDDYTKKMVTSLQEIKNLEELLHHLAAKLIELDKESSCLSDQVVQLSSLYDSCSKLVQEEGQLSAKNAKQRFDQLHDQYTESMAEKDALKLVNKDLNSKVTEIEKVQGFMMVQHAEECHLAEERIRKLESEAENLVSNKIAMESVVTRLKEEIERSSESSRLSENKMHDLLVKFSALESEYKDGTEKLHAEIHKKTEEIGLMQEEIGQREQHVDSLEKQVSDLNNMMDEKEQLHLQYKDRERLLEDQKAEIQALLAADENKLAEAKKQYDLMLESKQSELSRHLKEISQRNDQAINDIRRKYESEKLEIVNFEKEKADKTIAEMERKYEQKLEESRKDLKQHLTLIQEEHNALVSRIRQEYDEKELNLKAEHREELRRVQFQAENELREKSTILRNEHEVQMRVLKDQHVDECQKLQEELNLQKSKEDRQRALLQLQWKVMSDKPREEQEVDSKKDYSLSSIKMRNPGDGKRGQHTPKKFEDEEQNSPFLRATQTPVTSLLKKVEKAKAGSVMSIPKHSRKVTHHEYEVETSNGRTITKRRKRTVMFGDSRKQKKLKSPKVRTPRDAVKVIKGGGHPHPSNIGDLFTEGSLNPYADDPYAFD